ncbi:PAS domain-containing protein [Brevundimonas sp. LM2]|uniref:PAS domain-containing protein n=1 Tax=Brevundimonas sp. LM2 TaxID=1938605 RepID=UPI0015C53EE7|nr:PAS domain-containing protein [Brevundimonas sp. LM2]
MSDSAAFDRLTELAAALFQAPVAAITAQDGDRVWFRSNRGFGDKDATVEESFCRHLIGTEPGSTLVVEDATKDPLFAQNRWVTDEGVRFYAGAVITTRDGGQDGAICVIDTIARGTPTESQMQSLRLLAQLVGQEIDQARSLRRQAEHLAMLEMSEAMAGVGHWSCDLKTGVITWSDEVFRIHGMEPGSVNPNFQSIGGHYHPDDRAVVWELIQRARHTGEGYDLRLRLIRNGEERVTRTQARAERDATGTVVSLFGVFQDITDSVRLERGQAEMVETLSMAEALAGVGSWRLDVATGRVTWSDEVYRIHGKTRETFDPNLGNAILCYHPDDRAAVEASCDRSIRTGDAAEFQLRIIRDDGEERIVRSRCRPERQAGVTTAVFGVFQDVTDNVLSRARIEASEARYRLLADRASDIIVTYGVDGRILYISPSIEAATGLSPEALKGTPVTDLILNEDLPGLAARFREMVKAAPGEVMPGVTNRARLASGELRWMEARTTLVRDPDGRVVEFHDVVRDITETKQLEDDLIAARDVAEAAARAKAEFLANMSHELRTPLTSVIGFAGLLRESAALPEAERRYADRIATASDALLGVINDILDYSKLEAEAVDLDPVAFDPAAMARAAAEIIETQCEAKGLSLAVDIASDLPAAIMGDEGRLRQVALNFLSNAMKFTASGQIRLDVGAVGARLRVAVTDSGIGIAADKIDGLFDRFTQADASTTRVYGGTGLGLAICQRLIEMMGGEIGVTSRPGEGSTFWFEVPLIAAEAADAQTIQTAGDLPAGLKVLMADDAPANRELVRILLQAWGVDLHTVCDGAEAVQAAARGSYDLILMDVHMPVMDGMNATRAIRALGGTVGATPILALTANVQPEQVAACRAAGMDGHVGKPIQIAQLIGQMTDLLSRPEDMVLARRAV